MIGIIYKENVSNILQLRFCTNRHNRNFHDQDQAPVVQKVDNAIHRINHYVQLVSLTLIRGIVIYPLDIAIQLLNSWGQ